MYFLLNLICTCIQLNQLLTLGLYHSQFEEAAKEVADEITAPRPEGEEKVHDIQVLLSSDGNCSSLRDMKVQILFSWRIRYLMPINATNSYPNNAFNFQSDFVSRLVKISGIVVAASGIRAKATKIAIQCRSCRNVIPNLAVKPGLDGYAMPRKCNT